MDKTPNPGDVTTREQLREFLNSLPPSEKTRIMEFAQTHVGPSAAKVKKGPARAGKA